MTDTKSNLFLMIFVSSKNWKSVLKNRYYYCIFLQSVSVSWFPPEIRNLNLKTDTKPAFLLNLFLFRDFLQELEIFILKQILNLHSSSICFCFMISSRNWKSAISPAAPIQIFSLTLTHMGLYFHRYPPPFLKKGHPRIYNNNNSVFNIFECFWVPVK